MKLTWLGHAAFRIETAKAVILVDPFLNGNPGAKGIDFKEATKGVTHIALTHGHGDHVGDTVAIARSMARQSLPMPISQAGLVVRVWKSSILAIRVARWRKTGSPLPSSMHSTLRQC